MKRSLSKVTVFLLICAIFVGSASAAVVTVQSSLYLSDYNAWVTASGSGSVEVGYSVNATRTMTSIGATKIVIQQKSGSSWVAVKTYYSSTTSKLLASNTNSMAGCITYNGTSGNTYRAIVTVFAGNSSGSGSATVTTGSVTA